MRWERLFAEMEARFEALAQEQADGEMADRERVAVGSITARQRLAGALDHPIRIRLAGGLTVAGTLRSVGRIGSCWPNRPIAIVWCHGRRSPSCWG